MKLYTADPHYYHENIIRYENRPYSSVEEMNADLVAKSNAKVGKNDELHIIGDFSFGTEEQTLDILRQLHGRLTLITGNHDRLTPEIRSKFQWIGNYKTVKDQGRIIVLFHYPIAVWDRMHYGSLHFYGHIHSNIGPHPLGFIIKNAYNAGVDVNGMAPVNLQEVLVSPNFVSL